MDTSIICKERLNEFLKKVKVNVFIERHNEDQRCKGTHDRG